MKPNENVAKDLAYQQMIYNKLLELDTRMANLYPYTDLNQDVLEGGTRLRNHPLPGISMETYSPSTLVVGGNQDDFLSNLSKNKGLPKSRPQIQRPPLRMNATNATIPLTAGSLNNRMEIVKKVMKEQGLTLGKASKFVKDNNLYQKIGLGGNVLNKVKDAYKKNVKNTKLGSDIRKTARKGLSMGYDKGIDLLDSNKYTKPVGALGRKAKGKVIDKSMELSGLGYDMEGSGNKSGKISRIKKANKWRDFSVDTINKGMDLGQRGLDMFNKQKDRQIDKAKDGIMKIFGKGMEGGKRPPSKWILYVKKYASDNNISYKNALKEAGESYKNSK